MKRDAKESWARERIEAWVQTGRLTLEPVPIHPDLAAHMSEADQRLCTEAMAAIKWFLEIATGRLKEGRSGAGPMRWAAESLFLLADVTERADTALLAERDARWEASWEARWKAEAPFRTAWAAQTRWTRRWARTTPEGKEWQARLDAAPNPAAYTRLMEEALAVYGAWEQAHPKAAARRRRPPEAGTGGGEIKQLTEWAFDFDLVPAEPEGSLPHQVAEDLRYQVVPQWLEEREYAIGGSFFGLLPGHWRYGFGICTTREGQLIPEEHAAQLLEVIRQYAAQHGGRIVRGYREYTARELKG